MYLRPHRSTNTMPATVPRAFTPAGASATYKDDGNETHLCTPLNSLPFMRCNLVAADGTCIMEEILRTDHL